MKESFTAVRADCSLAWALALNKDVAARTWTRPTSLADAFVPMLREQSARTAAKLLFMMQDIFGKILGGMLWQMLHSNNWVVIYSEEVKYIVEHKVK